VPLYCRRKVSCGERLLGSVLIAAWQPAASVAAKVGGVLQRLRFTLCRKRQGLPGVSGVPLTTEGRTGLPFNFSLVQRDARRLPFTSASRSTVIDSKAAAATTDGHRAFPGKHPSKRCQVNVSLLFGTTSCSTSTQRNRFGTPSERNCGHTCRAVASRCHIAPTPASRAQIRDLDTPSFGGPATYRECVLPS
jgi:hypothetical protein